MKAFFLTPIFIFFLFLSLQGCSSQKKSETAKKLILESTPAGASVYSLNGEKIAVTPVTFLETDLLKISSGDSYAFIVKYPGYVEREVVVGLFGLSRIELTLTPNNKNQFDEMLNSYSAEVNTMARSLLLVQGLIFLKKYEQAALKLNEIQPKYPLVAAVYTLLGNVYFNTGKLYEAREQFSRAVSLDPDDDSAKRFLNLQKAQ